ncbi:MAG: hypothetical protein OQK98_08475 [Gammaproteobacteria bacterium]|nr:hypothetical protein [Gammaproteobacteria bacterium]
MKASKIVASLAKDSNPYKKVSVSFDIYLFLQSDRHWRITLYQRISSMLGRLIRYCLQKLKLSIKIPAFMIMRHLNQNSIKVSFRVKLGLGGERPRGSQVNG